MAMSDRYKDNKSEIIGSIDKNNRGDSIIISKVTDSSGNVSVDIRLHYTNDNDEICPTQKGVRFKAEQTYEIMQALVKCMSDEEQVAFVNSLA